MEYYSAIKKNSFESVLMRWMKLEPIIQSEVSQKDKDHYSILTHIPYIWNIYIYINTAYSIYMEYIYIYTNTAFHIYGI